MQISVILPAAGLGQRFATGSARACSKVEYELGGKAVFLHAADLFLGRADIAQVLLAVDPDKFDDFQFRWGDKLSFIGVTAVPGGKADRWQSVQAALQHLSPNATHVAVHDAARPVASSAMIDRVIEAAAHYDAVVPGLPMGDTLKQVAEGVRSEAEPDPLEALLSPAGGKPQARRVERTIPRAGVYRVQTPQVFERALLCACYAQLNVANAGGITDDASVVERAGHAVHLVEGDPLNLKLTHPADAELLEAVLRIRQESSARETAERALFGDDDDD